LVRFKGIGVTHSFKLKNSTDRMRVMTCCNSLVPSITEEKEKADLAGKQKSTLIKFGRSRKFESKLTKKGTLSISFKNFFTAS
jgi:hypothetical protein